MNEERVVYNKLIVEHSYLMSVISLMGIFQSPKQPILVRGSNKPDNDGLLTYFCIRQSL